ncbi:hypothetical protein [Aquabacter spiritensis]|uniref:Uncharacterized protein n=1 Tax=Aquabacter spiritensis TaxID=933073 RepID=A0A4R3M685_9HYPH|nr:hypothetical protein [Aquabacter spiritensis]TCT06765.1 hypothetical protein EDC64_102245 [Aquabacter spiritensis]
MTLVPDHQGSQFKALARKLECDEGEARCDGWLKHGGEREADAGESRRMKIPLWYIGQWVIWLFTGLPIQWFFTAFNGLSFLTLPDPPNPDGVSLASWGALLVFLYHPILSAPFAVWWAWRRSRGNKRPVR